MWAPMSRTRRHLSRTLHVRIPTATLEALEKMARSRAGKRTLPHGAVSDLVRFAIATLLTNGETQRATDRAPAHGNCNDANTSIENSVATTSPDLSPGDTQAA